MIRCDYSSFVPTESAFAQQLQDHPQHARAIAPGVELRGAARGPVAVLDRQLAHAEALVERVQREVGLDLEAFHDDRIGLDEAAAEGAIAAEDVGELRLE